MTMMMIKVMVNNFVSVLAHSLDVRCQLGVYCCSRSHSALHLFAHSVECSNSCHTPLQTSGVTLISVYILHSNSSLHQLWRSSPLSLQKQQSKVYRSRWPRLQTVASTSLSWEIMDMTVGWNRWLCISVTFISWQHSTRL